MADKPREVGVYAITCVTTGKQYVGSSNHIPRRWYGHRRALSRGEHHSAQLQRSWNKYGAEAFLFEVLERCSPECLVALEQEYLDKLRPEFNTLATAGETPHGFPKSAEARAKISAALKGRPLSAERRNRLATVHRGRKRSAETRLKMSRANIGLVRTPEHCANLSRALQGRPGSQKGPLSPETRAKIGAAQRTRWAESRSRQAQ